MHATPLCRNGKPRKRTKHGRPKATITQARFNLRQVTWERVKHLLQAHLQASNQGEASRMARAIGIDPSQIHRFACPVCEHDAEPTFTVGVAILLYLSLARCLHPVDPTLQTRTQHTHPQYHK